jgi:hypothetical protein
MAFKRRDNISKVLKTDFPLVKNDHRLLLPAENRILPM